MVNSESFVVIDNTSAVDIAIESLDLNVAKMVECEATIATLESDLDNLRSNRSGLQVKSRGTRLTSPLLCAKSLLQTKRHSRPRTLN